MSALVGGDRVLIVGASARAVAWSAIRAGLRPCAIDLFADRDLASVASVGRVSRDQWPQGVPALARQFPAAPWLYTGALENHSILVDRLGEERPLWGNGGDVLRRVRDPIAVAEVLRRADLPCAKVTLDSRHLPRDGSWLVKPLASAGGRGIQPLRDAWSRNGNRATNAVYFQERIKGVDRSAVFVADLNRVRFAGVTVQLVGRSNAPFGYRGSIGPCPIPRALLQRVQAIGKVVAAAFGLRGLFGIDFVVRDGLPWLVEINPRYTASVEVIELATKQALLAEHRSAFTSVPNEVQSATIKRPARCVGKWIVYAPCRCRFPTFLKQSCEPSPPPRVGDDLFQVPPCADLPEPGATFEPGEPVLTLLDEGPSVATCWKKLRLRAQRWHTRLKLACLSSERREK